MHSLPLLTALVSFAVTCLAASPQLESGAFDPRLVKRQQSSTNSSIVGPVVDLGYERYQGVANKTTGLNTWLGVRYAAPPTGSMRWQPPAAPAVNRSRVLPANVLPPRCPQSPFAPIQPGFDFSGEEDCLFLSVYAPPNKTNLPVFVYIHGGGYGGGQGNADPSILIGTNNYNFIAVIIQYRLGAFGFLSSDEVHRYGTVNAGLLDQTFALEWVQKYIGLFGGNASQVTVAGESAGAGSVMLQTMAFGGRLGDSLFENAIVASPYLPEQFGYADFVPSQTYYAFASAVGCFTGQPPGKASNSIFECLVGKDTISLQNASAIISASGRFGTWAFLPVTDGTFIQDLPSRQLLQKQVNGRRILSGNNANEGPLFVPQDINTEDDFVAYVRDSFPLFTQNDISRLLNYYPSLSSSVKSSDPLFATSGASGPTALNQSSFATGQQQRANNLYAETTFVCPSYWLAEAFTDNGREAWKYQFSPTASLHGLDTAAYFGGGALFGQSEGFIRAFNTIFGNFVTKSDPSIPADIAAGGSGTSSSSSTNGEIDPASIDPNPPATEAQIEHWTPYTLFNPIMLNLNQSGGSPVSRPGYPPPVQLPNVTEFEGPDVRNVFSFVDALSWEGDRGARCEFWRSVGGIVPE